MEHGTFPFATPRTCYSEPEWAVLVQGRDLYVYFSPWPRLAALEVGWIEADFVGRSDLSISWLCRRDLRDDMD